MEQNTLILILFALLLFGGIFGNPLAIYLPLGFIGYGAYVYHQEGRLGKKKDKKLKKKDKVKGGSIFE
jgi:hypothetical protein